MYALVCFVYTFDTFLVCSLFRVPFALLFIVTKPENNANFSQFYGQNASETGEWKIFCNSNKLSNIIINTE